MSNLTYVSQVWFSSKLVLQGHSILTTVFDLDLVLWGFKKKALSSPRSGSITISDGSESKLDQVRSN